MRPERWPFFYGWVIVGAAFVASGLSSGAAIWGPSVLLLPMTEELDWSRAEFFSAFLVRELLIGLAAPLVGPLYDSKHGPRILALVGAVLLGLSMALIRYVTELWQFIALFGVLGGVAELGGGFFISQALVPKWFVRKRGRALGVSVMGAGLGALLFPTGVSALIEAVGWRDAWLWFGITVGGIAFLLGLFLYTRPEDSGMLPDDGPSREALSRGAAQTVDERSLTRREAVRTPAFWLLLAAFSLVGLGITGFQSNWHPFLVETGFTPGTRCGRHRRVRVHVRHRAARLGTARRTVPRALPARRRLDRHCGAHRHLPERANGGDTAARHVHGRGHHGGIPHPARTAHRQLFRAGPTSAR